MKVGDLIVHIGAKPNGYRIRLACKFYTEVAYLNEMNDPVYREKVWFVDGRWDWKDSWRVFNGWN